MVPVCRRAEGGAEECTRCSIGRHVSPAREPGRYVFLLLSLADGASCGRTTTLYQEDRKQVGTSSTTVFYWFNWELPSTTTIFYWFYWELTHTTLRPISVLEYHIKRYVNFIYYYYYYYYYTTSCLLVLLGAAPYNHSQLLVILKPAQYIHVYLRATVAFPV